MDFADKKPVKNPAETANPLSRLFFWWMFPLFWKGSKRDLHTSDLFDALKEDEAQKLGQQLGEAWDRELRESDKRGRCPQFHRAIIKVFLWPYLLFCLTMILSECIMRIVQVICLHRLILSFQDGSPATLQEQFLYGTGIILSTFFYTMMIHPAVFGIMHIGMKLRVAACSVIYRKALRLSKSAQGQSSVGQLVNIMSNDVNRFDMNLVMLPYWVLGPLQTSIILYLMWTEGNYGVTCLAGAGLLFFLIPLQYFNSKLFAKFRLDMARRTDKRGQIMSEIIIAMRVIKMYAWERPFSGVVDQLRKLEVKVLRKASLLRAVYMSLFMSASKLISYVTILVFIATGGELTAANIFFLLTGSNFLRLTVVYTIPNAAAQYGELRISIQRIQEFLMLDEIKPKARQQFMLIPKNNEVAEKTEPRVSLVNAFASWTSERSTLENVSVNFRGDKLVMVVGSVGSGKTSFLHSLLYELPVSQGILNVQGRISYASQEPWIFSGNLHQNILFGREYDKARYDDVVEVSALRDDLKQLPFGENTIVGERGVALSGGQKARVNLARALYQDADIYLLDDPLSAVDARVSRHIFEKCVKQHLAGKLRILVTHQLQYLPRADHIVVLNKGQVVAQGTYQALIQEGVDFLSLITAEEDSERKSSTRNSSGSEAEEQVPQELIKTDEEPEKKDEASSGGSVTARTYLDYFRSGGNYFMMFLLALGLITSQVCYSFGDYWLSYWTRKAEGHNCSSESSLLSYQVDGIQPGTKFVLASEETCEPFEHSYYFYVYTGLVVGMFVITKVVAIYFFMYCMRISINLHNQMFTSMVRAPTKFFDDNPSGRIMNRFTKDIGSMDELLPPAFYDALVNFFLMIGSVALVVVANYYLVVPAVILLVSLVYIRKFFITTAREVKRLEAIARSPIYTHVVATFQGLTTIRASDSEKILIQQFDSNQDLHSSAWYIFLAANRWFGVWLEMVSLLFLAVVTYGFLGLAGIQDLDGGQVGLAISSCLGLNGVFQWGMRQSAETENLMTSVERALEYSKLEPEAPLESKPDKKPPATWPGTGALCFRNVFLSYGDKDVLRNLSFEMTAKEKIGIVGRTGAGKSTIIAALFRITEPRGDVFIDNVRINDIGLHDLRKGISIIPQDPVLFSGSIRYNLDPFELYEDDELWRVIEEVELKEAISALDFQVADGGSNFSVGQRQLVCLARAILRKNKILIMDEATANVDPRTDGFIQKTIRSKFAECSIITIAHRLHSVMDCDKILVLDEGVLQEYDHPHRLLQNPQGFLSVMVEHTGPSSSSMLRQMAKDSYNRMTDSASPALEPSKMDDLQHEVSAEGGDSPFIDKW